MKVAAAGLLAVVCASACGGGGGTSSSPPLPTPSELATSPSTSEPTPSTVSLEQSTLAFTVQSADVFPIKLVYVLIDHLPSNGVWVRGQYTRDAIDSVDFGTSGARIAVTVKLKRAGTVGPGMHTEIVNLRVCFDQACNIPIGDPLTATIDYNVDIPAGGPPIPVVASTPLSHDVLDAEFSQTLNLIVMVSANPRPALYLYDLATAVERAIPLSTVPKHVSLSRDGMKAAVGHNSLITYVDLQAVAQNSPPVTQLLGLSTDVSAIVLGDRSVYVIPDGTWWVQMRSIDIASNAETSSDQAWPGSRAKLLPNGDYFYTALSTGGLEKWDVRSGAAILGAHPSYYGPQDSCGNLWISEDAATIYTACGAQFTSTTDAATDMKFIAKFDFPPLDDVHSPGRRIAALSESAEKGEVMLVEAQTNPTCDDVRVYDTDCISRLYLYNSVSRAKVGDYSLGPLVVGEKRYAQQGLFLFHTANGDGRYLVSRAAGLSDPAAGYFISRIQGTAATQ